MTRYPLRRLLAVSLLLVAMLAGRAVAQEDEPPAGPGRERIAPKQEYHLIFRLFEEGEYEKALKFYLKMGRTAIRGVDGHWIDSICYHTMAGECFYHMGDLQQALPHYDSAIKLYLRFPNWLQRVQFPPNVRLQPVTRPPVPPWSSQPHPIRMAEIPNKMLVGQGKLNDPALRQGGIAQPPTLYPITPHEIVRCTALAIRRRNELMGPVANYDPLTAQLVKTLEIRPALPDHWSQVWIDVQLGLAHLSAGDVVSAKAALQRSLIIVELEHPMSSTAYLELGKIALAEEKWAQAGTFFVQAAGSAFQSADNGSLDIIEEAFRYGFVAQMMANPQTAYAELKPLADWARKGTTVVEASATLLMAENLLLLGNAEQAAALIDGSFRRRIAESEMWSGVMGARYRYVAAMINYHLGRVDDGDGALQETLNFQRGGASKRVFQIALADTLFTEGLVSPRDAMGLYHDTLREPSSFDWRVDPMDSLAVLVIPYPQAWDNWFMVAMEHLRPPQPAAALEIADLSRRHHFYTTLGMGGRLLSLRWLLEAPQAVLDAQAVQQRQALLVQHPAYDRLSKQAAALRKQLRQHPLVAVDQDATRQQAALLTELNKSSLTQEAMLRALAVRREPAQLVFPPRHTVKALGDALPATTGLLAFHAAGRDLYAFLITGAKFTHWRIGPVEQVHQQVARVLGDMRNIDPKRDVRVADLDEVWRGTCTQMYDSLMSNSPMQLTADLKELVIVPDGPLWYLPFEALQIKQAGGSVSLISQFRIRYAPTAGLAIPDGRVRRPAPNTAVVVGRMMIGEDDSATQTAYDQLIRAVPRAEALGKSLPGTSAMFSSLIDQLVVYDEILPDGIPYAWSPARGR